MGKTIYKTPKNFTAPSIRSFISDIRGIFSLQEKQVSDVFFDVSETENINILGALLIYKFLDFTVHKKCFLRPTTNLNLKSSKYIASELKKMGFRQLVEECFTEKTLDDENFTYQENNNCFISPTVLERNSGISGIGKSNEKRINDYYAYDITIASVVLSCLGEISSNFQEHAETDTRSVILATGDKQHFEVACADNGVGILSSLKGNFGLQFRKAPYLILKKSTERGISSKLSEGHMGCGLWLVNEYVTQAKGYMCIYSENGYYINKKGIIKCGESPYWKGTIVYVNIPIRDSNVLSEVIKSIKTREEYF